MNSIRLSIVVVTYNCEGFIFSFFEGLISSLKNYYDYELLVFDNCSTDCTVQILNSFSQLKVTTSNINVGFAKGNNALIKQASFENILLLNPDVFGFNTTFWELLTRKWDRKNPMVIKLINEDGTFQDCVGEVTSLKRMVRNIFHKTDYSKINFATEVEMGIMAFMIIPDECFKKVGLIAEDYHMYAEDMDWCYRAKKNSYQIIYNPELSLTHIGGGSAKSRWQGKKSLKVKFKAERIFINKHYRGLYKEIMLVLNTVKQLRVI